jgi:uncharacterized membrane protein
MGTRPKYTCSDYREEMTLLSLKRRLAREDLSEEEKRAIIEEIKRLEAIMRMNK